MLTNLVTELSQAVGRSAQGPQNVRAVDNREDDSGQAQQAPKKETRDQTRSDEDPVVDRQRIEDTIVSALRSDFPPNSTLKIDVSENTGGFIYKAVDKDSGEVVKQFPAEEVLERLERMAKLQGLGVDGRV